MDDKYTDDVNIALDTNFISRLRHDEVLVNDIDKLLLMSAGRQHTILRAFNGAIKPSYEVYCHMLNEIPTAPVIKITNLLVSTNIGVAKDIMDVTEPNKLLLVVHKLSLQSVYSAYRALTYLILIEYGLRICLVKYLSGRLTTTDVLDLFGRVCYDMKLQDLNPMLYRNINNVFNIDRWINKQKLLNNLS